MKPKMKYLIALFLSLTILMGFISYRIVLSSFSGSEESVPKYLETTLPCSYVVDSNTSHTFLYNGTTLHLDESSSSNRSLPVQNAIDTLTADIGGMIFVRSGDYVDASVTVKNNVVLMLEVGVSGFDYTVTGTGVVMRYANGYAILDAPLNMTGHQILYGVFHSGSAKPSNPVEAQWFYDTDDHTLYIWNSTDWEDYSSAVQGEQGPAGPAGKVEGLPFTYLCFTNATSSYLVNGTTGEIDDSGTGVYVLQTALDSDSSAKTIHLKKGFTASGTITVTYSGVSLLGDSAPAEYGDVTPSITKLVLNSSGTGSDLRSCLFEGIQFKEIRFFTGTGTSEEVRYNYFRNCKVRSSSAENTQGIVFDGEGIYMNDFTHFLDCYFYQVSAQDGYGFITLLKNKGGCSIFWLDHCHYYTEADNMTYFYDQGSEGGQIVHTASTIALQGEGFTMVRYNVTNYNRGIEWIWSDGSIEVEPYFTLAHISGSAGTLGTFFADIHDNRIMCKGYAGHYSDFIVINNEHSNTAWRGHSNGLMFHDNYEIGLTEGDMHDIYIGTPAEGEYFRVNIYDNLGFPTRKTGSSEASNDDWIEHGLGRWEDGLTPEFISLAVEESDARYVVNPIARNDTHFQISLYYANGTVCTIDKTIMWSAEAYQP